LIQASALHAWSGRADFAAKKVGFSGLAQLNREDGRGCLAIAGSLPHNRSVNVVGAKKFWAFLEDRYFDEFPADQLEDSIFQNRVRSGL
jgi:hypothetical protein